MPYTLIFGLFSQAFIGKRFPIQGYFSCIYGNFEMNTCVFEIHFMSCGYDCPSFFQDKHFFSKWYKIQKPSVYAVNEGCIIYK